MSRSRYLIGIDLGTSNSALGYIDTLESRPGEVQVLPVKQLESIGRTKEQSVLPSFLYLATQHEIETKSLALDFQSNEQGPLFAAGFFALQQTADLPGRVVSSAKSWLCHAGVDREEKILPWGSEEIESSAKLSPVEASAVYLRHLRDLWDSTLGAFHPEYRFEKQDVTITVPASFDEVAQRLTLKAAQIAGYPEQVRLLEEPQAAFYHWLSCHGGRHQAFSKFKADTDAFNILVCDIGGGTTDFSLFEAKSNSAGKVALDRIAVSDHLLLGGDNIDLALAHLLEAQLVGPPDGANSKKLSNRQFRHLLFSARELKERVLNQEEGESDRNYHVSVPGEGSSLFSGSLSTSVTQGMVRRLVMEGFFPACASEDRPDKRAVALREWGLPYASDSRVTHHLAAFLNGRHIDAVLFNGGTLKPSFLREHLLQVIGFWQDGGAPFQLELKDMELAVARGAAIFAHALSNKSQWISAGYPRSVYVELYNPEEQRSTPELVCLLPQGFLGSKKIALEHKFHLLIDQPVRFQLYSSTHRPQDKAGAVVSLSSDDFIPLPPVQAAIMLDAGMEKPKNNLLEIGLESTLNQLGMLQLNCVYKLPSGKNRYWNLEFNLRKALNTEVENEGDINPAVESSVPTEKLRKVNSRISFFYGKKQQLDTKASPRKLIGEIEDIFQLRREDWDTGLLRSLWPALCSGITRRGRSLAHETTWLYLAGFLLRPGYGAPLDDWRMGQLWRCFELGLNFPRESSAQVQWWIMWRRVAGGLDREKQELLYRKIEPKLWQKGKEEPEIWRLAGALERISLEKKGLLAEELTARIASARQSRIEEYIWALGRIASRVPLYASLHQTLAPEKVAASFERLRDLDWSKKDYSLLNGAFSQMGRLTGDRHRDLNPDALREICRKMTLSGASGAQLKPLKECTELDLTYQNQLFGETLPSGLRLARDK